MEKSSAPPPSRTDNGILPQESDDRCKEGGGKEINKYLMTSKPPPPRSAKASYPEEASAKRGLLVQNVYLEYFASRHF
jgi:hypothetical protein